PLLITGSGTNPINLANPVGSSAGNVTDDGSGGVSYSIPIEVLRGSGGMNPSVSLNYSSRGGKGNAGQGWNISAFSAITRRGKDNFLDGFSRAATYTNSGDAFELDGERLFPVSGLNGGNATVYGKENEDFSTIQSFGGSETTGPDYFIVTKKNGTILEYGRSTESKFLNDNGSSTMIWLLNKVTDQNQNYYTLVYNIDEPNRNFSIYEINYTGNTVAGVLPYNKIVFKYALVANWQYGLKYTAGSSIRSPYILDKIEIVNSVGTKVKTYQCAYSVLNGDYFLREFSETGADGNKFNPLQFTYGIAVITPAVQISNQFEGINSTDIFGGTGSSQKSYAGNFVDNGKSGFLTAYYNQTGGGPLQFKGYSISSGFYEFPYTSPVQEGGGIIKLFPNYSHDIIGMSNMNFRNSNDYDGDGKTDVLFTSYTYDEPAAIQRLTSVQINYTRRFSTGLGYDSSVFVSPAFYKRVNPNGGAYVIPGDFDGDGVQDYILILGNDAGTEYKMYFNSPKKGFVNKEIQELGAAANISFASLISSTSSSRVQAIDFDGDGKKEILVGNIVIVISENPGLPGNYSASVLHEAAWGLITGSSPIYNGDFNGDGMTDLLVRHSSVVNNNWRILYSTGKEFKSFAFQFNYIPNISEYGEDQSTDILMVSDLNRDGRSDIWLSQDYDNNGSTASRHSLYLSQGMPIDPANAAAAFILSVSTSATSIAYDNQQPRVIGDFDGDGKQDILITQAGPSNGLVNPSRIIFPRPLQEDLLMVKAVNGLGKETTINYTRLNVSSTYNKSSDITIPAAGPSQNPYNILSNSSFVVQSINGPDGVGGTASLYYHYTDAVYHPQRGFLGFKQLKETHSATANGSLTIKDINTALLEPYVVNTYKFINGSIVGTTTITNDFIRLQPSNPLDKRYVHRFPKIVHTDEINGTAQEVSHTYDNYNNVTLNTLKQGTLTGSSVTAVETITTSTSYGVHGTPVPALPESFTVTSTRNGQTPFSKKTDLTYDNAGNMLTKLEFSGKPKALTTSNQYDAFGN
ncbi:MAG: hypothetical protein EOO04_24435, partial [Chitinophagaceae bacterium]